MKGARPAILAFGLILAFRPGCGPYKPKEESPKEVRKIPALCNEGSGVCYEGCFKRQEGDICGSCCLEQLIHCDEGKAYDFKKCDTVERDVRKIWSSED